MRTLDFGPWREQRDHEERSIITISARDRQLNNRRGRSMSASHQLCLWLAVAILVASTNMEVARADDDDHERALNALRAGEIVSLREMLVEIDQRWIGQVIEVELARSDDDDGQTWIYEIKLLSHDGNVANIDVDAKTKRVLRVVGRAVERSPRPQ